LLEIGGTSASVECRRREDGGAEGAEGDRVWGGVSPSPLGRSLGVGCVLSLEKFLIFELKRRVLVHSGCCFAAELNGNWLA